MEDDERQTTTSSILCINQRRCGEDVTCNDENIKLNCDEQHVFFMLANLVRRAWNARDST